MVINMNAMAIDLERYFKNYQEILDIIGYETDGGTSLLKALCINGYIQKEVKRWVIDSTKHPHPSYVSKRISQSVRK